MCCSPCGRKESDTTECLSNNNNRNCALHTAEGLKVRVKSCLCSAYQSAHRGIPLISSEKDPLFSYRSTHRSCHFLTLTEMTF